MSGDKCTLIGSSASVIQVDANQPQRNDRMCSGCCGTFHFRLPQTVVENCPTSPEVARVEWYSGHGHVHLLHESWVALQGTVVAIRDDRALISCGGCMVSVPNSSLDVDEKVTFTITKEPYKTMERVYTTRSKRKAHVT